MSKPKYFFIVSMNVKLEYEDLFNEVYDTEHVPYLLEVPGVQKVYRGRGLPFSFSIGGETIAIYELDSPEVVNSDEWSVAVEKGRWGTHVREHTSERSHFMYESC